MWHKSRIEEDRGASLWDEDLKINQELEPLQQEINRCCTVSGNTTDQTKRYYWLKRALVIWILFSSWNFGQRNKVGQLAKGVHSGDNHSVATGGTQVCD